jgi:ATP-dependent Lon protease
MSPDELPLLALRSTIVLPHGTIAVQVGSAENLSALRATPDGAQVLAAVVQGPTATDAAKVAGRIGVVATVRERVSAGAGTVQVTLTGVRRARIVSVSTGGAHPIATTEPATEVTCARDAAEPLLSRIIGAAESLAEVDERFAAETAGLVRRHAGDPSRAADVATAHAGLRVAERDDLVQCLDVT